MAASVTTTPTGWTSASCPDEISTSRTENKRPIEEANAMRPATSSADSRYL